MHICDKDCLKISHMHKTSMYIRVLSHAYKPCLAWHSRTRLRLHARIYCLKLVDILCYSYLNAAYRIFNGKTSSMLLDVPLFGKKVAFTSREKNSTIVFRIVMVRFSIVTLRETKTIIKVPKI